jgi:hypothetical protein
MMFEKNVSATPTNKAAEIKKIQTRPFLARFPKVSEVFMLIGFYGGMGRMRGVCNTPLQN